MKIAGICRFSLLGKGDWKIYQGAIEEKVKEIADKQASILFAPERIENRLATLQHLTLASLRAQTDQDFIFIILASEAMPQTYRQKLIEICDTVPQVVLRFFPLIHAAKAQREVFSNLGVDFKNTLQFRLDDDDAICTTYVQKKRDISLRLVSRGDPFAVSFRTVMFCSTGEGYNGIYSWDAPFFSAGAALHHPNRSIFDFGHFAMARRFTSVVLNNGMSLVTHAGSNDTQFDAGRIRRQNFIKMDDKEIRLSSAKHFPFLVDEGRNLAGLPT